MNKRQQDFAGCWLIAFCLIAFAAMAFGAYKGDQARGITIDQSLRSNGL